MSSRPKFQLFVRPIGSIERSKLSKSTTSRAVAEKAFSGLINHDDLYGHPVEVLLMHEGALVACHRCDAKRGDELNWRGRQMRFLGQKPRLAGQTRCQAANG
jgi:hypothetical protein